MQQCVKKDDKPASFMGGGGGVDQEIIIKVFKVRENSGNFILREGKLIFEDMSVRIENVTSLI